jgi:phosphoribosylanthranilate isomerase
MSFRTRIKICGITRPQDAAAAARCGADAIGMLFHEASPRCISIERAREILAVLPAFVTPVALFVDADAATIRRVTSELSLRHVQLHGDESPRMIEALSGLRILKTIRVNNDFEKTLAPWRQTSLAGIVLETSGTPEPGGSGVENDWETVKRLAERGVFKEAPPVIAAGGLNPQNVGNVVRMLRPWAVDLSSGVESSKGIKSQEKIEAFVQAVRAAE